MNAHPEGMARIECRVDGDPRLIAGAAMIVAHVARRAGLANVAASDLADATIQTCRAILESMDETGSHTVRLSASELPNSIEISVEPLGGPGGHQLSPEQSHVLADRVRQTLKASADGVNVKVQEELSRVTLVKNCGAAKHPFAV
jgi:hypothetical protein